MKCTLTVANRLSYLPLRDAVLCTECEFISADSGKTCSVCGGRSLLRVCDLLGQQGGSACLNIQGAFEFFALRLGSEISSREEKLG